jgi:DICT domain-containing protein/predicted DNA-binding transcriptional regulator AlpA
VSEPLLTIREFAAASGVSEGTLRIWEARHGFPQPERLPSGHRRYPQRELEVVRAVLRAREDGLPLPLAIERARRLAAEPRPSIFGALQDRFPELRPQLLPKRVLVHLSHAIEDECCQRAHRPLLFACFQRERFYRAEEARWRELSRTAERAVVFADFARARRPRGGPAEVPIGPADELRREWAIVCDALSAAACLVGWERPSPPRDERRFETIWTVDRAVVREAARVCCGLAERSAPEAVEGLRERLAETPAPASEDVRAAVDLTTRMVLYATAPQ